MREPPSLPHKVPFIGHLLGIITKQVGHFRDVRYVEQTRRTWNSHSLADKAVLVASY